MRVAGACDLEIHRSGFCRKEAQTIQMSPLVGHVAQMRESIECAGELGIRIRNEASFTPLFRTGKSPPATLRTLAFESVDLERLSQNPFQPTAHSHARPHLSTVIQTTPSVSGWFALFCGQKNPINDNLPPPRFRRHRRTIAARGIVSRKTSGEICLSRRRMPLVLRTFFAASRKSFNKFHFFVRPVDCFFPHAPSPPLLCLFAGRSRARHGRLVFRRHFRTKPPKDNYPRQTGPAKVTRGVCRSALSRRRSRTYPSS